MTQERTRRGKQRHGRTALRQSGMNILELMVVVAMVGILALIAMPNMRVIVENSQVRSTTNDLSGALAMARSESLVQGGLLLRARVVDGDASFNNGWCIVPVGLTCENGGTTIVRAYESRPAVTITETTASGTQVRFDGRGALVLGAGVAPPVFTIQHNNCLLPDTAERAREVRVVRSGRVTVQAGNCQ